MKPSRWDRQFDNRLGIDESVSETNMPPGSLIAGLNMNIDSLGRRRARRGASKAFYVGAAVTSIYDYIKNDGTQYVLACAGTKIYKKNGTSATEINSGLTNNLPWSMETMADLCVGVNGTDTPWKFDGTNFSRLGIAKPANIPALALQAGGALPVGTYKYYFTFYDNATGHESNPWGAQTAAPTATTGGGNLTVRITLQAKGSASEAVTHYRIYRSTADGTTLWRTAELAYATYEPVAGTGFYDDAGDDDGTIQLDYDNDPPPSACPYCLEWNNRVYYWGDTAGLLYYSKKGYANAVPVLNQFAIGREEKVLWCFVYRGALNICTNYKTYILPDDPDNMGAPEPVAQVGVAAPYLGVASDLYTGILSPSGFYFGEPTDFDAQDLRTNSVGKAIKRTAGSIAWSVISTGRSVIHSDAAVDHALFLLPFESDSQPSKIMVFDGRVSQWTIHKYHWPLRCFARVKVSGQLVLYAGDANGYVWQLYDDTCKADGSSAAKETLNGTATGGTIATLTDTGKTWTVNAFAGLYVKLLTGTGSGQVGLITSNTATELTISGLTTAPAVGTTYAVGHYEQYVEEFWNHFGAPERRKRVRELELYFSNESNAKVDVELRVDHVVGETMANAEQLELQGISGFWGVGVWGVGYWGSVRQMVKRLCVGKKGRFFSLKVRNNEAGARFDLDGYALRFQDLDAQRKASEWGGA